MTKKSSVKDPIKLEVTKRIEERQSKSTREISSVNKYLVSCLTMSSLLIFNRPVVGKTALLRQMSQQIH